MPLLCPWWRRTRAVHSPTPENICLFLDSPIPCLGDLGIIFGLCPEPCTALSFVLWQQLGPQVLIFVAQQHPRCGNWAAGVMKQYAGLGMPSLFSSSGITALNSLGFQANMEGQHCKVWDGLHVSPRLAPSKGAKLCTYFAWFFRPSQLRFEPYLDIPMHISRLRLLMQVWMGSHSLRVEQGRLARPMVPRQLRRCTFCSIHAIGNEQHYIFDCPHFAYIRRQFRSLFQDS